MLDAGIDINNGYDGTGEVFVRGSQTYGENWCYGPVDLPTSARLSNSAGTPTIEVGTWSQWWVRAILESCPSGPGSLPANVNLVSDQCTGVEDFPSFGALGTVTFTQTDGGLAGWITVDAGTFFPAATFQFPVE
jgi:hypothetical protein